MGGPGHAASYSGNVSCRNGPMQHLIMFAGKSGVLRKYVEKLRNFPVLLPVETYAKRFIRPSKRFGWRRLQSQGSMDYQNMASSSYHGHTLIQGEISRFVLCILWDVKVNLRPIYLCELLENGNTKRILQLQQSRLWMQQCTKMQSSKGELEWRCPRHSSCKSTTRHHRRKFVKAPHDTGYVCENSSRIRCNHTGFPRLLKS
jgi:hypothetical protein